MKAINVLSKSTDQTLRLGERLAKHLRKGDIVCLEGDLGSGKTTLIKGIAQGLKIAPEKVNSPTFVLMNAYHGRLPLYHFDLYRMHDPREWLDAGFRDVSDGRAVSLIEWPERLGRHLPSRRLEVQLSMDGDGRIARLIDFDDWSTRLHGDWRPTPESGS